MNFTARLAASTLLALGLTGCFEIEQGLVLEQDLSGRATAHVVIDMEQIVETVARLKKQMSGEEGDPTKDELAEARKELEEKQAQEREELAQKAAAERAKLEASLPEGVRLTEYEQRIEGLRVTMRMGFAFDHVSKLSRIELPEDDEEEAEDAPPGMPGVPAGKPMKKPFEGLTVEELEGGLVRVTMKPENPAAELTREPPAAPEGEGDGMGGMGGGMEGLGGALDGMKDMMMAALKGMKVAIKIESTSMEVVETNALTRKDKAAHWDLDLGKLMSLEPAELEKKAKEAGGLADEPPFVVFRRR
ncbi:MAG: hypothetical protein M9894_33395 [Planctomycetes bacterium]|nr:hypothetical protein [Planctomycetota bacterium]